MITKLAIKGLRCFKDFTLDGIAPITLIAGSNNVGKSTLLESLFLFFNRNSNDIFIQLNAIRRISLVNPSPKMLWEHLFTNMDMNNAIEISIENDLGETQRIVINKENKFPLSSHISLQHNTELFGLPLKYSYPLKVCYSEADGNEIITYFTLTEKGIVLTSPNSIEATEPFTPYLSSNALPTPQQVAELFGILELQGKKSQCIEILQLLEPRIKDMSVIVISGISSVFADIGLASKISMNMLGDGTNKLLSIVLVMLANPGAVFLIDEIENGFHYSFYPKLWEIIGELAIMTGCQVFATTHSYECITGATVLAEDTGKSEMFRFIRLDWHNDEITPKAFENDSFRYAIENNWEVR